MSRADDEWSRLMRAGIGGDEAAYRHLLLAMAPVLRGIVRARGPALGADQGEDVVQEILLAIHLKRGTWDAEQPLRPWVYAIARHKIVDAFRRRGRRIHLPVEDFAEVLEGAAVADPFEARDAARLIDRLDGRDAALLRCLAIEGRGAAVCGAGLGLSPGGLRVALHRALKRLAAIRAEDGT